MFYHAGLILVADVMSRSFWGLFFLLQTLYDGTHFMYRGNKQAICTLKT